MINRTTRGNPRKRETVTRILDLLEKNNGNCSIYSMSGVSNNLCVSVKKQNSEHSKLFFVPNKVGFLALSTYLKSTINVTKGPIFLGFGKDIISACSVAKFAPKQFAEKVELKAVIIDKKLYDEKDFLSSISSLKSSSDLNKQIISSIYSPILRLCAFLETYGKSED